MEKRRGIVLKKDQTKATVSLLDQHLGKIAATTRASYLCTGALITYSVVPLRRSYNLESVELIYAPFSLAREDILFLHHVLELCALVVQEGQEGESVITLISFLYQSDHKLSSFSKKLFVGKLCMTLGLYPEGRQVNTPLFESLSVESLDTMLHRSINLEFEKELDTWLFYCIGAYPDARHLKTLHFLTRNRVV